MLRKSTLSWAFITANLISSTICFSATTAQPISKEKETIVQPSNHFIGRATLGVIVTSSSHQSQNLSLTTGLDANSVYRNNTPAHGKGILGAFLGGEFPLSSIYEGLAWQPGVSYYQNQATNYGGQLAQRLGLVTDNYTYQYKISSSQVLFENRLLFAFRTMYHPYFLVGVGEAFNQAANFLTMPQEATFGDTPLFLNKSTSAFSYLLGVGLDFDVWQNARFGVGYRYNGLGRAALAQSIEQQTTVQFRQKSLSTNQIVAEFTLII